MPIRHLIRPTIWLLTLAYPWLWYYGRGARALALLMAAAWLLRAILAPRRAVRLGALALAAYFTATTLLDNKNALTLYPLIINATLLIAFTASLIHPPSAIERLARLQHPDLPPAGIAYTRRVTQIWCGYFIVNGGIIATLSLIGAERAWALYTGVISYILMGLLLAGEWLYRRYRLKT
ncbi:COG4648 family protein [Cardiobacterium valvarum]|uniref:Predicted membrane protein n=1 Tax=Cardiobacterium valvarum TaxID=194702 RepID=A0A381E162_9GAMM|nr:hypothetical protein [Cardiobacterium valvarum]SUX19719.1 Predicted membrane protein [Cardiobacterium valvarum]